MAEEIDVAIIGGGPAGLSAAAELKARGVARVVVFERDRQAGGVPKVCGHSPYGLREFRRPMLGPAYARALRARAITAGVEIRERTMVTHLAPGPRLTVSAADTGEAEVEARAVLIATGGRETPRAARLIGGTKPGGVLVTGALQSLVYGATLRPFRRPVILGTELVAFSALLTCRHAGIRPVAMVDPGPRITARRPADLLPRLMGIPLSLGTEVAAVEGRDRTQAVILRDESGERRVEADGLIVTGGFRPESALARAAGLDIDPHTGGPAVDAAGRCSLRGVYAAGNVLRGIETAGWCWDEGRRIAGAIARDLGGMAEQGGTPVHLEGAALKYAMPQRIAPGAAAALDVLQVRMARAARGRLALRVDGHEVQGKTLTALPERRLLLPLPRSGTRIEVAFEEAS